MAEPVAQPEPQPTPEVKVEEKVDQAPVTEAKPEEPKVEDKVEDNIPETKSEEESDDDLPSELKSILESFKKIGRISMVDMLALKNLDICTCKKEEKSIYINPIIFGRRSERQTCTFGKNNRKKQGNFNKGRYHDHRDHRDHRNHHDRKNDNFRQEKPYHPQPAHGGNEIKRNRVSTKVLEMRKKAEKWKNHLDTVDNSDVTPQIKALLNKITPDNYKKLRDPIRDVYVSCRTDDDVKKFIKVVFKKATHEDKYCGMYTNLIKYLGEQEYNIKNEGGEQTPIDGSPSKKSNLRKAKESRLKKDLIEECKSTLSEFQNEMNFDNIPDGDKDDFEYRYKKRLLGNLKFIAELYKKKLIGAAVPLYVLSHLLAINSTGLTLNNFTIEGACTFISKVGEKLDKNNPFVEQPADEAKDKMELKKSSSKSADNNTIAFELIIKKLTELQKDETVESRIRIIIQNTLAKRENQWMDNIVDEGPKTKKQIRKDHMRELQGLPEEPKQAKAKSPKQRPSGSGKEFADLSLEKMVSTTSIISELDEEEEKHVVKQYSPRELEHRDHEAIKDRFIGNFVEWLANGEYNLDLFSKEENRCSGDKIVEFLLDKLYDKENHEIKKFNEYLFQMFQLKLFTIKDMEKGISSFFETIPSIESDFPHLPDLFSDLLYYMFIEKNIADFAKVEIKLVGDTGKP